MGDGSREFFCDQLIKHFGYCIEDGDGSAVAYVSPGSRFIDGCDVAAFPVVQKDAGAQ